MNNDPFDLQRFVDAQSSSYDAVLSELRRGQKTGHWMWFIFPQIAGLGQSPMATRFAISCLQEARAYLQHTLLETRLVECTNLTTQRAGRSLQEIFGSPDDLKFRSCMTLFAHAAAAGNVFQHALRHFAVEYDPLTLERI